MDAHPSAWIERFAPRIPAQEPVLDVAAGSGRHSRLLAARGHPVLAVDHDVSGLAPLADDLPVEVVRADLETGGPPPFAGRRFGGVVVTNYLHRPLLPTLVGAVAPGGVLLYETFAVGNERFGPPTNPDYLLEREELLEAVRGRLTVVAYEDLIVDEPRRAWMQRVCATRSQEGSDAG